MSEKRIKELEEVIRSLIFPIAFSEDELYLLWVTALNKPVPEDIAKRIGAIAEAQERARNLLAEVNGDEIGSC